MTSVYFGANLLRGAAADPAVARGGGAVVVAVQIAGRIWEQRFTLRGPGDVIAVDPTVVARVWPPPSTRNVETNLLAYAELADPALVWAMSPVAARAERATPWLSLWVLRDDEHAPFRDGDPFLVLAPGAARPPLDQAWAWAHLQGGSAEAFSPGLGARVDAGTSGLVARLVAPRRLQPRTVYRAVMVPTFDATAQAMGGGGDRLPAVYSWAFETGEGGDFEALARKLARRSVVGSPLETMTLGRWLPGATAQRRVLLSVVGTVHDPVTPRSPIALRLEPLIDQPPGTSAAYTIPPPRYGAAYADNAPVHARDIDGPARGWYHRLNLDPALRAVAGLGAALVRADEDALVDAAWQQLEGVVSFNRQLAGLQLGREVAQRSMARLVTPETRGRQAFAARQVEPTGPVPPPTPTLDAIGSHAWRRVLRARGPLGRRLGSPTTAADVYQDWRPVPAEPPVRVANVPPWKLWFGSGLRPVTPTPIVRWTPGGRGPATPYTLTAAEQDALNGQLQTLEKRLSVMLIAGNETGLLVMFLFVWWYLDQATAAARILPGHAPDEVTPRIAAIEPRLAYAGATMFEGGTAAAPDDLDPRTHAPQFTAPIFDIVRRHAADWLFPDGQVIADDSLALIAVDPVFIEALLVGLNDQLGRELAWRGFPVPPGATYFRRFWPVGPGMPPLAPIDTWNGAIGSHAGSIGLVLAVRGELLRRYPGAILFAAAADGDRPSGDPARCRLPILRGSLAGGLAFFGFDLREDEVRSAPGRAGWFFGLAEPPHEPRFGLDEGAPDETAAFWDSLAWDDVTTRDGWIDLATPAGRPRPRPDVFSTGDGATSATIARVLMQRPFLVLRHADQFLAEATR